MIFDSGELGFEMESFEQPMTYSVIGYEADNNCNQVQDLFDMIRVDRLQPLIERETLEPDDWQRFSGTTNSTSPDLVDLPQQGEKRQACEEDNPVTNVGQGGSLGESRQAVPRPQLKRRKSNPFYSPSRHIKNMIKKDKKRKYPSKNERGDHSDAVDQRVIGETHMNCTDKPFLERRQTVG